MFIRSVTNYPGAMPDDQGTVKGELRALCGELAQDLRPLVREGIKNLLSPEKRDDRQEPAPPKSEISHEPPSPPASKYFG